MINPYKEQSKVNPQREKGRREIANDCYQALIKARLAGAVYQIVLTVIDRTWGFNQTEAPITLSDFQKATGLSRQGIIKSVKTAGQLHLIIVEKHGGARNSNIYMFNKYYDTWLSSSQLALTPSSQPALTPSSQPQCTPETDSAVNCSLPEQSTSVDPSSQPALTPSSQLQCTPVGGDKGGGVKKYIKETSKETSKERTVTTETEFLTFIEETKSQFPDLDCEVEFKKFNLYWSEGKKKLQRPKLAWLNWLTKAREIKKQSEFLHGNKKGGNGNGQNKGHSIPGQRPAGAFADLAERDKDL